MTQAFNLSQLANKVNTSGQLDASTGLVNITPVANGGTGRSSVTSGRLIVGAGTGAMTLLAGTSVGDVVQWNGTTWTSGTASGTAPIVNVYSSPSPWSKPATLVAVKVTVIGGGGGGGGAKGVSGLPPSPSTGAHGGGGGSAIAFLPAASIPGAQTITVGAGGTAGIAPTTPAGQTAGGAGQTSSFGALVSATGGAGGTTPGAPGAGGTGSGNINVSGGRSADVGRSGGSNGTILSIPNQYAPTAAGAGIVGAPYGGGGTGAFVTSTTTGAAGGAGADGVVIVEEFY